MTSKMGKFLYYTVENCASSKSSGNTCDTVKLHFENTTLIKKIEKWPYPYENDVHIQSYIKRILINDKLSYQENTELGVMYATGICEGDVLTSSRLYGNKCTVVTIDNLNLCITVEFSGMVSEMSFSDLLYEGYPLIVFPTQDKQLGLLKRLLKGE